MPTIVVSRAVNPMRRLRGFAARFGSFLRRRPGRLGLMLLSFVCVPGLSYAQMSPASQQAVLRALEDEYHAEATYQVVLEAFGPVRPFSNILTAERRHSAALAGLLQDAGLAVPENPYLSGEKALEPLPATLAEACRVGVEAEIVNIALYDDQLLPAVAGEAQIAAVMKALRDASAQHHLPAFSAAPIAESAVRA